MRIFWRRPLFCCCVTAVVLTLLINLLPTGVRLFFVFGFAFAALLLALFLKKHFQKIFVPFLCCLMSSLLLLSSYLYFGVSYPSYQELIEKECRVAGYITDRRTRSDSYLMTVTELNGESVHFDAALDCDFSSGLQVGDHIEATLVGTLFQKDDGFDEEQSLLSDGVKILFLCREYDDLALSGKEGFHPILLFRKWNYTLSTRLRLAIGGEEGDLAAALLLGNKSWLSADSTLAFRRAGVSHLLALSGLHVSILIGALGFFLRYLIRRRWPRTILLALCLLFYLALTGFRASCVRAVLMVFSLYLARLLWEEPDPLTSLGAALYLTLLVTPYAAGDLALWMSYLATFGILVFAPAIKPLSDSLAQKLPHPFGKLLGRVLGILLVGVAANAALLLLMALTFGEVSILSIPATVVLSLPTELTLISSILTLIIPGLGFLPRFFAGLMIGFANLISDRPGVSPSMSSLLLIWLLVSLTILLAALATLHIKRLIGFLSLPLAVILIFSAAMVISAHRNAELVTDNADIRIEDGSVYVFAHNSTEATAARELKEELRALGASEIHHLSFSGYSNLQPYYLAKLSTSMRVFYLHLPQPATRQELAISLRVEQEASLHRIYVIYDG